MDLVGDEFINKWALSSNMSLAINNLALNSKLTDFIKDNFHIKSSNLKRLYAKDKIYIKLSNRIKSIDRSLNEYITEEMLLNIDDCIFYEKIKINNNTYCCDNETKFNNSIISMHNQIGQIVLIVKIYNNIYIICKKINDLAKPFASMEHKIDSSYRLCSLGFNSFFFIKDNFNHIKKNFIFHLEGRFCYASNFCSDHLFS